MRKLKLLGIVLAAVLAATMPAWSQPGVAPPVPPPASILGGYATLSASNVSARTALPAAIATYPTVTIKNSGTKDLYFAVGGSSVAATTSPTGVNAGKLLAGDVVTVFANGGFIALITGGTDTTTANLWQSSGAGVLSKNGTSSGGGAPSGPAGGDLAGTYPNPTVANLSTATGLPLATGIAGFGSGVATLLGGAASGTGGPAGTTSPSFVTPILGVASATSIAITPGANATPITITGASITGSSTVRPGVSIAGTLNTSGVVDGAALFANITNTASGAGTLLLDIQQGATSLLNLSTGTTSTAQLLGPNGSVTAVGLGFVGFSNYGLSAITNNTLLWVGGSREINVTFNQVRLRSGGAYSWSNATDNSGVADTFLMRSAAATFQFGNLDAGAPVAQTLGFQNVSAGTSNTAGVNTTFKGSAGTGTGAGGSLIFQTAPAGSTGTAQNAFVTALTLNSAQQALHADGAVGTPTMAFTNETNTGLYRVGASTFGIAVGGALKADYGISTASQWTVLSSFTAQGSITLQTAGLLSFAGRGIFTSPAVGQIQMGSDNTTVVAQTLSMGSYPTGAGNGSGANGTLQASLSTGTGLAGTYQVNTGFQSLSENANVTITNATPAVVTYTAHGLVPGASGQFTTTGTLPTGLSLATTYYVCATGLAVNTFQVSASWTSGACGTIVNTSSAGSGTHTFTTNTTVQNAPSAVAVFGPSGLTGSQAISALNLTQTWNTTGTPTALKLNVTNVASNAASLLMDLQVGGASQFNVAKSGSITSNATGTALSLPAGNLQIGGGQFFSWSNRISFSNPIDGTLNIGTNGGFNVPLSFPANNTLQLGLLDAAAPAAQTFQAQSVSTGTSNTAGANLTIGGSKSTGTGTGGSIIFQTAPAGSTGTAQNALVTALTIDSVQNLTGAGAISAATNVFAGAAATLGFTGRSNFKSPSDGVTTLFNSAQNDFTRLQLGGTTSSFPAIKRSAAAIAFRLADDSADAAITAAAGTFSNGVTVSTGALSVATGNLSMGSAQVIGWSSRSNFTSPADGQITLFNTSLNGFTRLNFGGTTSSFPSLKINGAIMQTRLADDSAYAAFEGSTLRTATAFTVSTLPAAGTQGRRAYVTDQLTTCAGVGVAPTGGGAKVCPVFDDGTSWVGG